MLNTHHHHRFPSLRENLYSVLSRRQPVSCEGGLRWRDFRWGRRPSQEESRRQIILLTYKRVLGTYVRFHKFIARWKVCDLTDVVLFSRCQECLNLHDTPQYKQPTNSTPWLWYVNAKSRIIWLVLFWTRMSRSWRSRIHQSWYFVGKCCTLKGTVCAEFCWEQILLCNSLSVCEYFVFLRLYFAAVLALSWDTIITNCGFWFLGINNR